jgi:hypothetical protein
MIIRLGKGLHRHAVIGQHVLSPVLFDNHSIINADLLGVRVESKALGQYGSLELH